MSPRAAARNERGSASLELVGMLPVVALVVSLVLQYVAAAYVAQVSDDAARQAARAYSLGRDPAAAADASLPGGLMAATVATFGPDHGVRITVRVPRLSPLPVSTVTRAAVMP